MFKCITFGAYLPREVSYSKTIKIGVLFTLAQRKSQEEEVDELGEECGRRMLYVDDTKEMCKDCKGCFFDILVGSFAIPFWRRTCLCLMQEDTSVVGNVCRS